MHHLQHGSNSRLLALCCDHTCNMDCTKKNSVVYFLLSVVLGEALQLAMRIPKGAEPISTVLLSIGAMCIWCTVPLFDAIPQHVIGLKLTRISLVLTVVVKGYALVSCKVNAADCRDYFADFSWQKEVSYSMQSTLLFGWLGLQSWANATSIVETEPILSTLNLRMSTHSVHAWKI